MHFMQLTQFAKGFAASSFFWKDSPVFNSATPGSFLSVGVKLFELAEHKTYRKERDNSVVIRGMGKGLEIASAL
jgi:hypothetical protein